MYAYQHKNKKMFLFSFRKWWIKVKVSPCFVPPSSFRPVDAISMHGGVNPGYFIQQQIFTGKPRISLKTLENTLYSSIFSLGNQGYPWKHWKMLKCWRKVNFVNLDSKGSLLAHRASPKNWRLCPQLLHSKHLILPKSRDSSSFFIQQLKPSKNIWSDGSVSVLTLRASFLLSLPSHIWMHGGVWWKSGILYTLVEIPCQLHGTPRLGITGIYTLLTFGQNSQWLLQIIILILSLGSRTWLNYNSCYLRQNYFSNVVSINFE